ncbi:hypothetical protein PMIN07_008167 [Paraphaeosphaeria minitans]
MRSSSTCWDTSGKLTSVYILISHNFLLDKLAFIGSPFGHGPPTWRRFSNPKSSSIWSARSPFVSRMEKKASMLAQIKHVAKKCIDDAILNTEPSHSSDLINRFEEACQPATNS